MSDIMFEADAHDPDHWRHYGRERYRWAMNQVLREANGSAVVIGEAHKRAIAILKANTTQTQGEAK